MVFIKYARSRQRLVCVIICLLAIPAKAQNVVTYAGGTGNEVFYDALRLSNGNYVVGSYADELNWIAAGVPRQVLGTLGTKNGPGTNKIGFILYLSSDLRTIFNVVHFPKGAVEDVRFIKVSNAPGQPTDALFISGNTGGTKANSGGDNTEFYNCCPLQMGLWPWAYTRRIRRVRVRRRETPCQQRTYRLGGSNSHRAKCGAGLPGNYSVRLREYPLHVGPVGRVE